MVPAQLEVISSYDAWPLLKYASEDGDGGLAKITIRHMGYYGSSRIFGTTLGTSVLFGRCPSLVAFFML